MGIDVDHPVWGELMNAVLDLKDDNVSLIDIIKAVIEIHTYWRNLN
jgi:hypothetical protein